MSVRSYLQSRNFNLDSVVDFQTLPVTDLDGVVVSTTNFSTSIGGNGHKYEYDSTEAKANHDGYSIISPTVPWDGTLANLPDFQAAVGETDGAGSGCWILVDTVREVSGRVRFEGPEIQEDILTDAQKGVASGVAELDGGGKVPLAQLPDTGTADLLNTTPITAVANIDFPTIFSDNTSYRYFMVSVEDMVNNAGAPNFQLRVSIDGSTFESGATDYEHIHSSRETGSTVVTTDTSSDDNSIVLGNALSISDRGDWKIKFQNPHSTSHRTPVYFERQHTFASGSFVTMMDGCGFYKGGVDDLTGIQLLLSSGTFNAGGNIKIYGSNVPF